MGRFHWRKRLLPIRSQGGQQAPNGAAMDDAESLLNAVDYYGVLNVPRDASQEDVAKAYRRLAQVFHPDKHQDDSLKRAAQEAFGKLQEAYEVLSDVHKRQIYDIYGKQVRQRHAHGGRQRSMGGGAGGRITAQGGRAATDCRAAGRHCKAWPCTITAHACMPAPQRPQVALGRSELGIVVAPSRHPVGISILSTCTFLHSRAMYRGSGYKV